MEKSKNAHVHTIFCSFWQLQVIDGKYYLFEFLLHIMYQNHKGPFWNSQKSNEKNIRAHVQKHGQSAEVCFQRKRRK